MIWEKLTLALKSDRASTSLFDSLVCIIHKIVTVGFVRSLKARGWVAERGVRWFEKVTVIKLLFYMGRRYLKV